MKRTSTGKRLELTARDLAIFELLERYRYLRSTFIHAFVGGASETRFKERLGDLYHEGGYLDRPKEQWQFANARYMPVVYEATDNARRILIECGRAGCLEGGEASKRGSGGQRQFAHTLMTCEVLASIELATIADPNLRFISAQEILIKAPERTRNSSHPFRIPCSQPSDVTCVIPDGLFGLEYLHGGKKGYRFFALEVDRATMPVVRSRKDQTSYLAKLLTYRDIIAKETHKSHLGLPNLFVLTVTVSERHKENIMQLFLKETSRSAVFLFKALTEAAASGGVPKPDPQLLHEPWDCIGHSTLCIASSTP
tara:strand:- start:763 stop:1695 length:933 start_codon:yes stop_codon:yes gene_type:complete